MSKFTATQLAVMSSILQTAQAAPAGSQARLDAVASYYQYQIDQNVGRGYATAALGVVKDTTFFGRVANEEIINFEGRSAWQSARADIAFNLASTDLAQLKLKDGAFLTEAQISDYHYVVFKSLGIPVTAFGGAADAALGLSWGSGLLSAEEEADTHSQNYSQLTPDQIQQAITALAGGINAVNFPSDSARVR